MMIPMPENTYLKQDVSRTRLAIWPICVSLVLAMVAPAASAQTGGQERRPASANPTPQTVPAPEEPVVVVDPYPLEDLGVTVLLPKQTRIDTQFVPGGRTKAVLTAEDNSWVIQIFNANSADTSLTIPMILDNFIEQRRNAVKAHEEANPQVFGRGINRKSALVVSGRIDPPNLRVADREAGRFYCDTPQINPNIATGYTVFQRSPGQFIIFQVDCMAESFARARQVYETVVASATFVDPEQANAERATAMLAGKSFIQSISNEDIEAVLSNDPIYYRLYRPARTGLASDATEVGWQRVQMRLGQRGELEPNKARDRWSSSDREYGYLVKIDGQITQNRTLFEIQAAYFLDRSRRNEAISIVNHQRVDGQIVWTSTVTVIRRGSMMTMNQIQTASPGETRDWSVPDEYISRVELELLPRLVALKTPEESTAEFDFAYLHYNVNNQRIQVRRDRFTNATVASGWIYRSEPGPFLPTVETTLDSKGDLLRRTTPDGVVFEPVTLERLRSLQGNSRTGP
jgi:hypothetical protein